jgi:hypothetical protein
MFSGFLHLPHSLTSPASLSEEAPHLRLTLDVGSFDDVGGAGEGGSTGEDEDGEEVRKGEDGAEIYAESAGEGEDGVVEIETEGVGKGEDGVEMEVEGAGEGEDDVEDADGDETSEDGRNADSKWVIQEAITYVSVLNTCVL